MNLGTKTISLALSGILLTGTIGLPISNAYAAEIEGEKVNSIILEGPISILDENEMKEKAAKAWKEAIIENQNDFVDPTVAETLLINLQSPSATVNPVIEPQGKATLTAKAGATALKALMNKIGKTAWRKMVKKVENATGWQITYFHWDKMNGLINWLSNSHGTISDAIQDYLVKKGMSKSKAKIAADVFVFIVF